MELIEMFVDELEEEQGIEAVSVVGDPATESTWVALKKNIKEFKLAEVSKERQILMGALLIPNEPIYRKQEDEEYYIFFRKETIRKIMEIFMKRGKQNNTTEEHEIKLDGNTIVEIWIKEDLKMDKSAIYGLNAPVGSLMISMKVSDKDKYHELKANKTGFSLEGFFTDKLTLSKTQKTTEENIIEQIKVLLS